LSRYLYAVLSKNQTVQDSNRSLLVETLRSIAEILIWGDQNDSSVFDFFLEKNMLSFFLKIMKQKCGSYVCVQLLQTLNILFENIRNETSLYYLLSNNHVNSIIVHKFDFSDEEVMAYYISFLKTLSLKLNSHTIHFFYNEHTNDFPLYTEAIKFFNHPESMVRIAVRTLTLNVYKVEDESMLRFIRDRTAAPYFSNLVWFIGNHILELDSCVRTDVDHSSKNRLADLVAEHLDHLHYLNDILRLNITELNYVLSDHLLNRLLAPLLVYSLNHHQNQTKMIDREFSRVVALFLLAQVFLIFSYSPLMQVLAKIILHGDNSLFTDNSPTVEGPIRLRPGFVAPEETLEKSLQSNTHSESNYESHEEAESERSFRSDKGSSSCSSKVNLETASKPLEESGESGIAEEASFFPLSLSSSKGKIADLEATHVNITDEEKEKMMFSEISCSVIVKCEMRYYKRVEWKENITKSYRFIFFLFYAALWLTERVNKELLSSSLGIKENGHVRLYYNTHLMEYLLKIISQSAQYNSKIRVVTLEMALNVLRHLIGLIESPSSASSTGETNSGGLRDQHLAALEGAKEEATLLLRNFYKGEEIFLDMFEDEWRELHRRPLNVEFLLQDESILLPPAGTPLTGIDFNKRLPCGEVERARRSMRVYFLIRELCLKIRGEADVHLPLTNPNACVQVSDVLDLNNSDLIACVVITRDNQRTRRFLVIDVIQLILVEPDHRKMGWGVAKFVGFLQAVIFYVLQDLEVSGDKDDSRVLHITIHRPSASSFVQGRPASPLLAAKFIFDDHIRCMAAKQRLTKGRLKARQRKLHQIARLLELPNNLQPCPSPPAHALSTMRQEAQRRSGNRGTELRSRSAHHKSRFSSSSSKGPGVAFKKDGGAVVNFSTGPNDDISQASEAMEGSVELNPPRRGPSRAASRSSSRPRPRSEEIPLENLSTSLGGGINDGPASGRGNGDSGSGAESMVGKVIIIF
ncbi:Protein CLEC16A, partial [Armadillidium nasatum]